MLVLSRKKNETIKIGDITIKIVGATGRVKVGIDAPKETKITRGEVPERKAA
jgi:carbon storage regulator CsrA